MGSTVGISIKTFNDRNANSSCFITISVIKNHSQSIVVLFLSNILSKSLKKVWVYVYTFCGWGLMLSDDPQPFFFLEKNRKEIEYLFICFWIIA